MDRLLDTNACIALINGKPQIVRRRFDEAVEGGAAMATSSVAVYEIWYGVAKSAKPEANRRRLEVFLAGPLEVVPFTNEDTALAGNLRATLEARGKPIGSYDILIAAQALRLKCVVVTASTREFSRVPSLAVEDWTKPAERRR